MRWRLTLGSYTVILEFHSFHIDTVPPVLNPPARTPVSCSDRISEGEKMARDKKKKLPESSVVGTLSVTDVISAAQTPQASHFDPGDGVNMPDAIVQLFPEAWRSTWRAEPCRKAGRWLDNIEFYEASCGMTLAKLAHPIIHNGSIIRLIYFHEWTHRLLDTVLSKTLSVETMRHCTLLGNPGIGKSIFQFQLIMYMFGTLYQEPPEDAGNRIKMIARVIVGEVIELYHLESRECVVVIYSELLYLNLDAPHVWIFYEPNDSDATVKYSKSYARIFLTSSF